jgi:hypothetical protein
MLVTRMLAGRPYQSYVPKPLFPARDAGLIQRFREVDAALATTCDADAFAAHAASAVVQRQNKHTAASALPVTRKALDVLLPCERTGLKQLKQVNALLLGTSHGEFRTKPVWVGAPHPGLSWHVGSPPDMLPGLMKRLIEDMPAEFPASLAATTLLFRLLQIHPFADGNGRTARLWSLHHIHRRIGPACGYLHLLDKLWDRKRFDIHALSLAAQSEDRLDPILMHVEATLRQTP